MAQVNEGTVLPATTRLSASRMNHTCL